MYEKCMKEGWVICMYNCASGHFVLCINIISRHLAKQSFVSPESSGNLARFSIVEGQFKRSSYDFVHRKCSGSLAWNGKHSHTSLDYQLVYDECSVSTDVQNYTSINQTSLAEILAFRTYFF